jgi:hypothetical protein
VDADAIAPATSFDNDDARPMVAPGLKMITNATAARQIVRTSPTPASPNLRPTTFATSHPPKSSTPVLRSGAKVETHRRWVALPTGARMPCRPPMTSTLNAQSKAATVKRITNEATANPKVIRNCPTRPGMSPAEALTTTPTLGPST